MVGINVHKTTARRIVNDSGLYGRMSRKKRRLAKKHKHVRLNYAKANIYKLETSRQKVLWSDETSLEIFRETIGGMFGKLLIRLLKRRICCQQLNMTAVAL